MNQGKNIKAMLEKIMQCHIRKTTSILAKQGKNSIIVLDFTVKLS